MSRKPRSAPALSETPACLATLRRPARRRDSASFAGSLVALVLAGCSLAPVPPRPQTIISTAPEKDVICYQVELEQPLEPVQYLGWTDASLRAVGYEPSNPLHPDCPVYEIYYSFHRGPALLASVQYRRDDSSPLPRLKHVRTLVHDPEDSSALVGRR